jgi:hypothetical protein
MLRPASLALASVLALGAPSVAMAAPSAPIAHVEKVAAPAPAAQSDATSYADREAKDQKVADYQGGNTVVIAMSGGAFVVLLFLLLLL